ncbi:MAG: glycosyl transferase family 1, partial [Planctomycetes bacterium]|nr:glycosyl transferase family 1 [Planctomycetota bacterium]
MKFDFTQYKKDNKETFDQYLREDLEKHSNKKLLKIDLHCHDYNSDNPDELWGRLLKLPETWIRTNELITCLNSNHVDAYTITNHNNARSCWDLLDRGEDVLPGAEFTCFFPEYDTHLHILTYGFTPSQEEKLNRYRKNIYQFLAYTTEMNLPTVVPHPLYYYSKKKPPMAMFEKMIVLFNRFEALNGQRDVLQNLLVRQWINGIDPNKIESLAKKHGIRIQNFSRTPYLKCLTGGSDDHIGVFAGSCGSYIFDEDMEYKLKYHKKSDIVLNALRQGNLFPYGTVSEHEKLCISLLDYFSQVVMNIKDPGLVRLMLHRGTVKDKLFCWLTGNGLLELKRHKYTRHFLKAFHDSLQGRRPGFFLNLRVPKHYRPCINQIDNLALARQQSPHDFMNALKSTSSIIFNSLNELIISRIKEWHSNGMGEKLKNTNLETVIRELELPLQARNLFAVDQATTNSERHFNVSDILDKLSFPVLVSTVVVSASLASTRVLNSNRRVTNRFSKMVGAITPPKRALWLTDTYEDKNGISTTLKVMLREIQKRDLPIDIMVISNTIKEEEHLKVLPSLGTFTIPGYDAHEFKVPNLLLIHEFFTRNCYDRVICSTEMLMGAVTLFIKQAFHVPIYFYMHTDWMEYVKQNTSLEPSAIARFRRLLRAFYRQFEGIFVLNSDHQRWLQHNSMGLKKKKIHRTSHWIEAHENPR